MAADMDGASGDRMAASPLRIGPITLNGPTGTALKGARPLRLSATEFRLLHYLMLHAGTVVPMQEVLRQVWGRADGDADVVRVTMHRLRRKLGDDPSRPRLLQ